jgi:hypothetical protein
MVTAKRSERQDVSRRQNAFEVRFLRGVSPRPLRKSLSRKTWMLVSLNFASWNQLDGWLRQIHGLRLAA